MVLKERRVRYGFGVMILALLAMASIPGALDRLNRPAYSSRQETPALPLTLDATPHVSIRDPKVKPGPNEKQKREVEEVETIALRRFSDWVRAFMAATPASRMAMEKEGAIRAAKRRDILKKLITVDPQKALAWAVSRNARTVLPEAVKKSLGTPVSGSGMFAVVGMTAPAGNKKGSPFERFVDLNGHSYRAFVYGRRLSMSTKRNIPLHGLVIDDVMAVHESPVRRLPAGELADPRTPLGNPNMKDPITGELVPDRTIASEIGGKIFYYATARHAEQHEGEFRTVELDGTGGDGSGSDTADSAWSEGPKTVLYMRVDFSDLAGEPVSKAAAEGRINVGVNDFIVDNSYGKTSFTATATSMLRMPQTSAWYKSNNDYLALLKDARAAALAAGYDTNDYDLDIVAFKRLFGGWSGRGYVKWKGTWLNGSFSFRTTTHELGHNLGLWHGNYWQASTESPIGPGTHREYGDSFDVMGGGGNASAHFSASYKYRLNWLTAAQVVDATASGSGTYTIQAFDQPLTTGFPAGIRINKTNAKDYWFGHRQKYTSNKWLSNGLTVHWDTISQGNGELLDMTVNSKDGKNDSALVIGRTFTDPSAGIHVTPIGKRGTSPEAIDVVVNLGDFINNNPPTLSVAANNSAVGTGVDVTFTASASDSNGDALAYYWDFGDRTFGTNSSTVSKSWGSTGEYVVQCTVTDMKGGTATDSIIITVGAPNTFRVSGNVAEGGQPVSGARVYVSSSISTFTNTDGTYALVGLPAGNHTVTAKKFAYGIFIDGFSNPVAVGPNATGIDFNAVPKTYSVSGTVLDNKVGVSGVIVSAGTATATTDGNGRYRLDGLRNGFYLCTATKSGYSWYAKWIYPYVSAGPLEVYGENQTGKDFLNLAGKTYGVTGVVMGVPLAASGVTVRTAGGNNTTSALYDARSGGWKYILSGVPSGSHTLQAISAGYTLIPDNFANPLTVSGNLYNINFKVGGSNTAPTISNISDVAINEDASTNAISFTVGDAETPAGSLTLTKTSSNTSLVPTSRIIFGGSGANRTVKVTPSANGFGVATITVTVADGSKSASDSFKLTVRAVNDTPTISNLTDKTINENASTGAIAFTVGDVETAPGSLTLTMGSSNTGLVPTSNIVFGGSGSNRTVTVTPTANATGVATITVTVSDGNKSRSDTFKLTVNAVASSAPTISNIANRTINEDTSTGAIGFTIGDAETAPGSLSLSKGSSNTTLVPTSNIVFGGSGANRTVTVTPAANRSGTTTITVRVSDGDKSTSDTFTLTVKAVNDTPTISNISDRTINEDSSTGAIGFTVGDVETSAGSLTLTKGSNNVTLVPTANIVFGGSGANRTVTVTPVANGSGTAVITVRVSDGNRSRSDTFKLIVIAVNDTPTISNISNRTINEDTSTGAIGFTVGDVETAAGSLTLTQGSSNLGLVPTSNIVFGGSGANRTVTVTPVANASGAAMITVRVSDGNRSRSDTFVLTVKAVNDTPTISNISNRTINEDTSTGAIGFTVGDVETAADSLTLTKGSSNVGLVPTSNIVFGGFGANRTVTVTPVANGTGSATITVRVSDGNRSRSDTFTVTVKAVNDAPTISNIQNKTIEEGASTGAITFTVGDVETAAGSLTLSKASSNLGLVPASNIVFGGSGANRTVTVTPVANGFGFVTISITVSDGNRTATERFGLTVTAQNDAPFISNISDKSINEDSTTGAIAFTVGDIESAAGSLTLSGTSSNLGLVPTSNISFGGSGADRTVTVRPVANRSGVATITIIVSDGSKAGSTSFLLTVRAINDAPVISSAPTANPNPAKAGAEVNFSVSASDVDNGTLIYDWDFGDGKNGTGSAPTHGYAAKGDYLVTVVVSDGQKTDTATLSVIVLDKAGGGGSGTAYEVSRLVALARFNRVGRDRFLIKATLGKLDADFEVEGKVISFDLAGARVLCTLDRKGRGKGDSCRMSLKKIRDVWTIMIRGSRGTWANTWINAGMKNETVQNVPLTLPCKLTVGGKVFVSDVAAVYSGKQDRRGLARTVRERKARK